MAGRLPLWDPSARTAQSAVPTGPWGRPLQAPAAPDGYTTRPERDAKVATARGAIPPSAYRPVGPPPPPPVTSRPAPASAAPYPVPVPAHLPTGLPTGRKWWARRWWTIEAAGAIGLLVLLGALIAPGAPRPPTGDQLWASVAGPSLVALGRDVVALQAQLDRQPTPAASLPLTGRLERDLRQAQKVPTAPDQALERAWREAVREAAAAVKVLGRRPDRSSGGPDPAVFNLATAQADLDAAGQSLVAISQVTRSWAALQPH